MPLTFAQPGVPVKVAGITGKDEVRRYLTSLGIHEGQSLTVISDFGGNVIVRVGETRIALSEAMARRVMV